VGTYNLLFLGTFTKTDLDIPLSTGFAEFYEICAR